MRPVSSRKAFGFHVTTCTVVRSLDERVTAGASVVVMFDCTDVPTSPVHTRSDVDIFPPWHAVRLRDGRDCVICTAFSRPAVTDKGVGSGAAADAVPAIGSPAGRARPVTRPISPYQLLAPQALFGPVAPDDGDTVDTSGVGGAADAVLGTVLDGALAAAAAVAVDAFTITAPCATCHVLRLGPMQRRVSLSVSVLCALTNDVLGLGADVSGTSSALVRDAEDGGLAVVSLSPSHAAVDAMSEAQMQDQPRFIGGLRVARSLSTCDHPALAEHVQRIAGLVPARLLVLQG